MTSQPKLATLSLSGQLCWFVFYISLITTWDPFTGIRAYMLTICLFHWNASSKDKEFVWLSIILFLLSRSFVGTNWTRKEYCWMNKQGWMGLDHLGTCSYGLDFIANALGNTYTIFQLWTIIYGFPDHALCFLNPIMLFLGQRLPIQLIILNLG